VVFVVVGRSDWSEGRNSVGEEGSWSCDRLSSLLSSSSRDFLTWLTSWTMAEDVSNAIFPLEEGWERRFWEMVSASNVNADRVSLGVSSTTSRSLTVLSTVAIVNLEIAARRDNSSRLLLESTISELGWTSDEEEEEDVGGGGEGACISSLPSYRHTLWSSSRVTRRPLPISTVRVIFN